jgi:hypothetical protein
MHGPTCIFWANLTLFSLQHGAPVSPKDTTNQPSSNAWDAPNIYGNRNAPGPRHICFGHGMAYTADEQVGVSLPAA